MAYKDADVVAARRRVVNFMVEKRYLIRSYDIERELDGLVGLVDFNPRVDIRIVERKPDISPLYHQRPRRL